MSRLTTKRYLQIHQYLLDHWVTDNNPFTYLTANEQWDLHTFFLGYKDMNPADLIQHRKDITIQDPGLPQRAGKAFVHFEQAVERLADPVTHPKPSERMLGIRSLVNPEPDMQKMARAFLELLIQSQR